MGKHDSLDDSMDTNFTVHFDKFDKHKHGVGAISYAKSHDVSLPDIIEDSEASSAHDRSKEITDTILQELCDEREGRMSIEEFIENGGKFPEHSRTSSPNCKTPRSSGPTSKKGIIPLIFKRHSGPSDNESKTWRDNKVEPLPREGDRTDGALPPYADKTRGGLKNRIRRCFSDLICKEGNA